MFSGEGDAAPPTPEARRREHAVARQRARDAATANKRVAAYKEREKERARERESKGITMQFESYDVVQARLEVDVLRAEKVARLGAEVRRHERRKHDKKNHRRHR